MNCLCRGAQKTLLLISGVLICTLFAIICALYIIAGILLEVIEHILMRLERKKMYEKKEKKETPY